MPACFGPDGVVLGLPWRAFAFAFCLCLQDLDHFAAWCRLPLPLPRPRQRCQRLDSVLVAVATLIFIIC